MGGEYSSLPTPPSFYMPSLLTFPSLTKPLPAKLLLLLCIWILIFKNEILFPYKRSFMLICKFQTTTTIFKVWGILSPKRESIINNSEAPHFRDSHFSAFWFFFFFYQYLAFILIASIHLYVPLKRCAFCLSMFPAFTDESS